MPSHDDLPGTLPAHKLIRALIRLGWEKNERGGKGSHCKMIWPPSQKMFTIPDHPLSKTFLKVLLKEIEHYSGLTWSQIREEL